MLKTIQEQAVSFGAELVQDSVADIRKEAEYFVIETENREPIHSQASHSGHRNGCQTGRQNRRSNQAGNRTVYQNHLQADESGKTNVEGIWAAGICAGASFHTIIAAGDGAKVAINVISELNGERYMDHDALPKK